VTQAGEDVLDEDPHTLPVRFRLSFSRPKGGRQFSASTGAR